MAGIRRWLRASGSAVQKSNPRTSTATSSTTRLASTTASAATGWYSEWARASRYQRATPPAM